MDDSRNPVRTSGTLTGACALDISAPIRALHACTPATLVGPVGLRLIRWLCLGNDRKCRDRNHSKGATLEKIGVLILRILTKIVRVLTETRFAVPTRNIKFSTWRICHPYPVGHRTLNARKIIATSRIPGKPKFGHLLLALSATRSHSRPQANPAHPPSVSPDQDGPGRRSVPITNLINLSGG